jgi:succinate dehydrogenase/fumarate reductase flavoprotein subunit/HEAT repeat protein
MDTEETMELAADVIVVGGGTAGTMAAITAAEHGADVLLLEKAHVRHSGALAMGMDGVNNAVIPGKATPEDYVREITRANDGIVNQRAVYQTASRGHDMVRRLEGYGVKFAKDARGDYDVRKVHRSGSYVLPMPEGKDVKKVLYRVLRRREIREKVRIENRVMPVRVLTRSDGAGGSRAVGIAGFHTRTGQFVTVKAKSVILATGAAGRLGLPASGYLYGTYENPTNAGDGHAMAYHAGAELSGLECFQVNPLIKDYNGPACAYVANPFGGYQVNAKGNRFVDCDYWSGQMMAEVAREISSARGPTYLKLTHLPHETLSELEGILHTTERPTRGTFHANRGHDYRTHDVEMHISEIGLCGGHSSSGVWVDENAATTVPGLYAAGDLACVPHNYMIGAFVFGDLAGAHATEFARGTEYATVLPEDQVEAARELIYRPLRNPDGPPQQQVEYKLRRFVNDYVAPPKTSARLAIALETFGRMRGEIAAMGARTPHELMRCAEVTFIRDCAELAVRASLARTESRWGLYHDNADFPGRDDANWFWHLNIRRGADGTPELVKRPVAPYIVPVDEFEVPARRVAEVVIPRADATPPGNFSAERPMAPSSPAADTAVPPGAPSPRLAELALLADSAGDHSAGASDWAGAPDWAGASGGQPSLAELTPYLSDPDPRVRRAAIATLTEIVPPGAGAALAEAAGDSHAGVRHAAVAALRELTEVLSPEVVSPGTGSPDTGSPGTVAAETGSPDTGCPGTVAAETASAAGTALLAAIRGRLDSRDPAVRAGLLDVLIQLRAGDPAPFAAALSDADHRVRAGAVRGLAATGYRDPLAGAAADRSREVRIAVAEAIAVLARGDGSSSRDVLIRVLAELAGDQDYLVRAAAFKAAALVGCQSPLDGLAAEAVRDAAAWEVRAGAAQALAAARPEVAVAPLAAAAGDAHADVRKQAVIALAGFRDDPVFRDDPAAAAAFESAAADTDADVRAYARANPFRMDGASIRSCAQTKTT